MWFYLYILASKKRVRAAIVWKEVKAFWKCWTRKKRIVCAIVCACRDSKFRRKMIREWVRNWPSCTYSRSCANDCVKRGLRSSLKLDEAWTATLASRQKKMIEQNVRKEIQKGKTQNNQGTKLLVVWIWFDGNNDERVRGVYWRINQA